MRLFALTALAATAFAGFIMVSSTDANAVVYARGVYRAGCATAHGAAVVHAPAAACRYVVVNGVRVRRCVQELESLASANLKGSRHHDRRP